MDEIWYMCLLVFMHTLGQVSYGCSILILNAYLHTLGLTNKYLKDSNQKPEGLL